MICVLKRDVALKYSLSPLLARKTFALHFQPISIQRIYLILLSEMRFFEHFFFENQTLLSGTLADRRYSNKKGGQRPLSEEKN